MAREYFAKALEVEESTGTDGRRTARASYMSNLAAVSRAAGDVDLARDQYCTALDHLRGMIPASEAVETALRGRKPVCFATAATRGRRGTPSAARASRRRLRSSWARAAS